MATHSYWALAVTEIFNPVSVVGISELRMMSTPGGTNLCTGGTASATSSYAGTSPADAFNGTTSGTSWNCNDPFSNPQRLIYQFASPVDIVQYEINTSVSTDYHPKSWRLEYSDDGTTWTEAGAVTNYSFSGTVGTFGAGAIDCPANAATIANAANEVPCYFVQEIGANASTFSHYATPAPYNTIQSIGANEATIGTLTATQATVAQIHNVGAYVATLSCSADAATVYQASVVGAYEASIANGATTATVSQIHIIGAVEAFLSTFAEVKDSVYLALNYHVGSKALTTYSNFSFTGSCNFDGQTLFINDSGLFEYGGNTDNGTAIVPSMKTGKIDSIMGRQGPVHSNRLKRIPSSRISVSCNKKQGSIDLNVTKDTATNAYNRAIAHDGFATYDVPIGRGKGGYNFIQLELVAHGCETLDINAIEFNNVELSRRER